MVGLFSNMKIHDSYLETGNFLLDIVGDVSIACAVGSVQGAQLALKSDLVQDLTDAHTTACGLVAVAGSNTLTGSANLATTKTLLLKTIDDRVEVKADVRTVRDKDALGSALQALGLDGGQLLEEAGDVEDGAGTDEVDAFGGNQTGGQDVEVVGDVLVDNGVAGICIQLKKTSWSVRVLRSSSKLAGNVAASQILTYCVHLLHDSRESPAATACL